MRLRFLVIVLMTFLMSTGLMAQGTIQLDKKGFLESVVNYEENAEEWVYLGDRPSIIDFYADWCRPCKIISPYLEELAKEYGDEIYIYKIDVDKEQDLARAFGIQSIPTLLFVPQKENPQIHSGMMSKEDLRTVIDELLLKK